MSVLWMLNREIENTCFTPTAATRIPDIAVIHGAFAACDFPSVAVALAVH